MAKYKRFDPKGKKAEQKRNRSESRLSHHLETKYFKQQKNELLYKHVLEDAEDYLEDHPFA